MSNAMRILHWSDRCGNSRDSRGGPLPVVARLPSAVPSPGFDDGTRDAARERMDVVDPVD